MKEETIEDKVFALTHHFTVNDEFERSIQNQILAPILDQNMFTILDFTGGKSGNSKIAEKYFKTINSVAFRLIQAYKHYKNYIIIEQARKKEILLDISKSEKFIDECWKPIELNCEIDAFLTKWKSTLDALVKSLIPLYGTKTLLFSRDKKYKFQIVAEITNNLSKEKKLALHQVCEHIGKSADMIQRIVKLRDDVVHFDKECLTPFHYHLPEGKLYLPNLKWGEKIYDPKNFMLQSIEFLRDFIRDFMVFSINGFADGMYLTITSDNHQWFVNDDKIKNKDDESWGQND